MTDADDVFVSSTTMRSAWTQLRPVFVQQHQAFSQLCPSLEPLLPATSILCQAYITRLHRWIAILDKTPELHSFVAEMYGGDVMELHSWLMPRLTDKFRLAAADQLGDILTSAGLKYSQTRALLENYLMKPGAPAKSRSLYLYACDLQLQDWTYRRIVEALCECGRRHDGNCEDRFRKGIKEVRQLLKKYSNVQQRT
jgi:hypothetical protein